MTNQVEKQGLPLANIILVCIAALASLASLKDGGSAGRSTASESWTGQGRSFTVTMLPVEDRLETFDYDGDLYLDLELENIVENAVDQITWTLTVGTESAEAFIKTGGVTFDEYNGQEDSRGFYGYAIARLGVLCQDKDGTTDGCIPCDSGVGCSFTIAIDLCYPDFSVRKGFSVRITEEDGSYFYLSCSDTPDTTPCSALSEWLTLESTPLETSVCSQ